MDTLLIFFLNRSSLDKVEKNQKPVFQISVCNLKWRAKFQIYGLHIRNFEDHALISISTILKFSAHDSWFKHRIFKKMHTFVMFQLSV